MTQFGIGQPVRRVEDRRFLTGHGHYLDDIDRPRQAHAVMLRSPHAHARIRAIDTGAAAAPGVLAVFTGAELAAGRHRHGPVPERRCQPRQITDGDAAAAGDRGAIGCAMSATPSRWSSPRRRRSARDAAERIVVDYEPLPAVVETGQALEPGQPAVWDRASRQSVLRLGDRRRRRGRARRCRRAPSRVAEPRQQPRCRPFDGAARGDRRIRSGRGRLHAVEFDPGLAFRAQHARRAHLP